MSHISAGTGRAFYELSLLRTWLSGHKDTDIIHVMLSESLASSEIQFLEPPALACVFEQWVGGWEIGSDIPWSLLT
jgi:hypothetical protein